MREHFDRALSAILGKKRGDNVEKTKQLLESMAVVKWGCEHALPRLLCLVGSGSGASLTCLWWRLVADCSPLEERSLCDAFSVVADTAGGEQDDDDDEAAEQGVDAVGQDDDEEEEPAAAAAAAAGGMDKRTVIDALGFGHEEKVVLRFDDRFWEGTKGGAVSHWQCLDQRFRE